VIDVKITDFGSVLNLVSERTQIFRVGSLAYMSPEQLDGDALDCRADIYSLAAVLYHLIAGRPPFDATQQAGADAPDLPRHAAVAADAARRRAAALESLIERSLAKRRATGRPTGTAFARELSALVADGAVPRGPLQGVLDSERFTLLRSLEFFAGFGDVELWEVVHRAQWQRHAFGHALYRKGEQGNSFHIIAQGQVEVFRDGQRVAQLGAGTSVGEMAYLAPSPSCARTAPTCWWPSRRRPSPSRPRRCEQLSLGTRHLFDAAFIRVLVRRLHAAHEALHHPRRILYLRVAGERARRRALPSPGARDNHSDRPTIPQSRGETR
jgi:eukaryotic-like serine/threonine-protein kinase